jgi:two-component system alkaline phosphatase synthesis response regulator PhoP
MSFRVLIVDDEPNIVTSLAFLMRGSNYEVRIARNGDEALRVLETFRPNLILLDVMLPQRSGFEVCREIRDKPAFAEMKIVMLTAKGRDLERDEGLGMGADAYVTKPFSTKDLMSTVRGLLKSTAQPSRSTR